MTWRLAALVAAVAIAGCDSGPLALEVPRAAHTATALERGVVLVAGGCVTDGCSTATATTELYDGRFHAGPRLTQPRDAHTATRLPGGRVLLVGGYAGEGRGALASAEICDRHVCRRTGSLATARGGHAAVAVPDGRVLVIGADGALAGTEIYDHGRFGPGPGLARGRQAHTATLLADGRVLVVGGYAASGAAIRAAELIDPATGHVEPAGRLATAAASTPPSGCATAVCS